MRAIRVMLPKWIDCELLCVCRGNRTGRDRYWTFTLLTINPSDRTSLLSWRDGLRPGYFLDRGAATRNERRSSEGKSQSSRGSAAKKTTARASPLIPPATQAEGGKGSLRNVVTCHRLDFNSLPTPPPRKWLLSWNYLPTLLSDQMASLGFNTIFSQIQNISSNSYG